MQTNQSTAAKNLCQGRTGRELFDATAPFVAEDRELSWWSLWSTFGILIASLSLASLTNFLAIKLIFSTISGLTMVRGFIIYHDFLHGAILKDSKLAKLMIYFYGMLLLTPPSSWRKSHNFHHAHVGQVEDSHIGSFPIFTTEMWKEASWFTRVQYCVSRHWLTIVFAYFTVFFLNICVLPLFENTKKHLDSLLTIFVHFGFMALIWNFFGFEVLFFSFLLPLIIASTAGAYLFYAQHNAEGLHVIPDDEWSYQQASLESSSFLKTNALMNWFTGNIGYHHVHHLNSRIPFYNLPKAMESIPELQNPETTELTFKEIFKCLNLKLWDADQSKMITFKEFNKLYT
ncbi:MAG: fatty acid desaturase [Bdellovibrionales bacterium]|nr:fatty acid desaturase [Bdellovibrionales bacterium]